MARALLAGRILKVAQEGMASVGERSPIACGQRKRLVSESSQRGLRIVTNDKHRRVGARTYRPVCADSVSATYRARFTAAVLAGWLICLLAVRWLIFYRRPAGSSMPK
jgi:hypothetical protein